MAWWIAARVVEMDGMDHGWARMGQVQHLQHLHESNELGTWAKLGGDMQVCNPSLEYLVAPCGVHANTCQANDVALAQ